MCYKTGPSLPNDHQEIEDIETKPNRLAHQSRHDSIYPSWVLLLLGQQSQTQDHAHTVDILIFLVGGMDAELSDFFIELTTPLFHQSTQNLEHKLLQISLHHWALYDLHNAFWLAAGSPGH